MQPAHFFRVIRRALSAIASPFTASRTAPTLTAIFIASDAGEPMQAVESVYAERNRGLQGDRYHDDNGHWQSIEGCQVTLITEHELQQAQRRTDIPLDSGAHRRNLVIDGIKLSALEGKRFQIGEAVFEYHKPRPPCGYLDRVEGKGIGRALSHRSGVCVRVVKGGMFSVGDSITVITT